MRRPLAAPGAWLLAGALGSPTAALAYPQFIAKGYVSCATCHYSPTGGGLPNSYGHAVAAPTVPDLLPLDWVSRARDALAKNDVTGLAPDGRVALQADVGLDARMLLTRSPLSVNAEPSWLVVPMLAEVGGVFAFGPLWLYGTVTPRRTGGDRLPNALVSREHWLGYRWGEVRAVRLGRLVVPFGLRIPDHTQYTREDLGFQQYDQAYALELDYCSEEWTGSLAGFIGDLWVAPELREVGAAVSAARSYGTQASVGASVLAGHRDAADRLAVALFGRARLPGASYLMAELDLQGRASRREDARQVGLAAMARAGIFPLESIELYAELGARAVFRSPSLTRLRYGVGASWKALPWVEISPSFLLEEDVENGMRSTPLLQLHAVY